MLDVRRHTKLSLTGGAMTGTAVAALFIISYIDTQVCPYE
jgi:hypothetical protein